MQDVFYHYLLSMLLVFTRIVSFMSAPISPLWGGRMIRRQTKIGLALLMTFLIAPHVPIPEKFSGSFVTILILVAYQVIVGVIIGYVSYTWFAAIEFGGGVIDIQMGLSSAASQDPLTKGPANMIRRLLLYFSLLLYLTMDGHHVMLMAVVKTFDVVPLTGPKFTSAFIFEVVALTGKMLFIGTIISLPVLGALFTVQVAMGIMAKVAPQMNVFMLSFPLNIMVSLILLAATIPIYAQVFQELLATGPEDTMQILKTMVPQ